MEKPSPRMRSLDKPSTAQRVGLPRGSPSPFRLAGNQPTSKALTTPPLARMAGTFYLVPPNAMGHSTYMPLSDRSPHRKQANSPLPGWRTPTSGHGTCSSLDSCCEGVTEALPPSDPRTQGILTPPLSLGVALPTFPTLGAFPRTRP